MKTFALLVALVGLIAVMSGKLGRAESPRTLQAQIGELQAQITGKREVLGQLRHYAATAPTRGSVIGTSSCGAPMTVTNDPAADVRAEIARVEKDLAADVAALAALQGKLAKTASR